MIVFSTQNPIGTDTLHNSFRDSSHNHASLVGKEKTDHKVEGPMPQLVLIYCTRKTVGGGLPRGSPFSTQGIFSIWNLNEALIVFSTWNFFFSRQGTGKHAVIVTISDKRKDKGWEKKNMEEITVI